MQAKLLLCSLVLSACAADQLAPEPIPFTTIVAGDNELGVRTWEVSGEVERTIIGRGGTGDRLVEATVSRDRLTPDDRVRVELVLPESASFDLLSTGEVLGEAPQPIANALFDEVGHQTTPVGVPETRSGSFLHGSIVLGWSLFGYGGVHDVGQVYPGLQRSETSGGERSNPRVLRCAVDWLSPSRSDFRAHIYYAIAADSWGFCNWHIDVE